MAMRRFTIEEANKLLPLLTLELGRMTTLRRQAAELAVELGGMERALAQLQAGEAPRGLEVQAGQFALCTAEFQRTIERINAIGCLLKEPEEGTIDFPAEESTGSSSTCAGSSASRRCSISMVRRRRTFGAARCRVR